MNESQMFVTITHINEYAGYEYFRPGMRVILRKDRDNLYDDEAVIALSEHGAKLGYLANSVHSVARGTHSAGYVYRMFEEETVCEVWFVTEESVIACLSPVTQEA